MLSIIVEIEGSNTGMSHNLYTLGPSPRIQVFFKVDSEFYDKIGQTPLLRVL